MFQIWEIISVFGFMNRNIRSKTKQYLFNEDWFDKGILYINDLFNPPLPGSKLFKELVLDFDISHHDRRKYNFLMKCIPSLWLDGPKSNDPDIFDDITANLLDVQKVPKFTYSVFTKTSIPVNHIAFWDNIADTDDHEDTDWEEIHRHNFKCSIDTQLCSFYFKVFHKAIAFNNFLFKINRKDSPNCDFCKNYPESIIHIFCECEYVIDFSLSNFDKIFGIYQDNFLTYSFLCVKYYIYISKSQNKKPNFNSFKVFVKG